VTPARHFLLAAVALAAVQPSQATEVIAIVATRTIYPGQAVAADHVSSIALEQCEGCAPGYIVDTRAIVGKIANKTILPNRLIYPEAFRSPAIIVKGADTTLVYRSGGLTISVKAMSLADAAIGEPVTVRSLLNGSVVTGVTQADGSVLAGGS
jgi:flagella basal body P-ring formation protein FlgA